MNDVVVTKMDSSGNDSSMVIYFMIPSLNIDSHYKIDNDTFVSLITEGGFSGLGKYLIKQLDIGLKALLE